MYDMKRTIRGEKHSVTIRTFGSDVTLSQPTTSKSAEIRIVLSREMLPEFCAVMGDHAKHWLRWMAGKPVEPYFDADLHAWTEIPGDSRHLTYRLRVPGGSLYRYGATEVSMVFVPDRD